MKTFIKLLDPMFTNGFIISAIIITVEIIACIVALLVYSKIIKGIKKARKANSNDVAFLLVDKIVKIGISSITALLICQEIIPLKNIGTALVATGGAAALLFSMFGKELAGNLIAGLQISIFKPFDKGDLISIPSENITGTIEDLNLRHVTIRTFENTLLMVPNKILNDSIIENKQADKDKPDCIFFTCDISYESDFEKAKELLLNYVKNSKDVIRKDEANVIVYKLKDSSVLLRLSFYVDDYSLGFKTRMSLNEYVLKEFPKHNIEIPYNRLKVITD